MDGNKFVHICQPRLDEPTLCSNVAYVHDELKHLTPEPLANFHSTCYLGIAHGPTMGFLRSKS